MSDEQQNPTADAEGAAAGADATVTNAAAADVEAALNDETLDDQAQDTDDEEGGAAATAEDDTSGEADEDTGPDVEQDEEGVAEVKDHSTTLLGSDEGAVPSQSRVPPGIPAGLQPGTREDRDTPPKQKS